MGKDEKTKRPRSIQVPRDLFSNLRAALRAVGRDTRRNDRQLTDDTRTRVEDAIDQLDTWQDSR